jgi:DegV family protein with EDD domain
MNKVAIVSDSTCDLLPSLIAKHNITIVPLYVTFENKDVFQDGINLTPEMLYDKVATYNSLPKTAAPSPEDFIKAFKPLIEKGYDIVYFGIGGGFSGTLQNAYIAKKEFPADRIYLLDSCNLSSGTGLLVLKAVKFAENGDNAETIKKKIEELVPKVHSQFTIDSFEYLYKGGRCNGVERLFGTVFKIKPIIRVVDGKMIVADKPRGKKMALDAMIKDILSHMNHLDKDNVMVTHTYA